MKFEINLLTLMLTGANFIILLVLLSKKKYKKEPVIKEEVKSELSVEEKTRLETQEKVIEFISTPVILNSFIEYENGYSTISITDSRGDFILLHGKTTSSYPYFCSVYSRAKYQYNIGKVIIK